MLPLAMSSRFFRLRCQAHHFAASFPIPRCERRGGIALPAPRAQLPLQLRQMPIAEDKDNTLCRSAPQTILHDHSVAFVPSASRDVGGRVLAITVSNMWSTCLETGGSRSYSRTTSRRKTCRNKPSLYSVRRPLRRRSICSRPPALSGCCRQTNPPIGGMKRTPTRNDLGSIAASVEIAFHGPVEGSGEISPHTRSDVANGPELQIDKRVVVRSSKCMYARCQSGRFPVLASPALEPHPGPKWRDWDKARQEECIACKASQERFISRLWDGHPQNESSIPHSGVSFQQAMSASVPEPDERPGRQVDEKRPTRRWPSEARVGLGTIVDVHSKDERYD